MNCSKCGNPIPDGMNRCICCGEPVTPTERQMAAENASPRAAYQSMHKRKLQASDCIASITELPLMLKRSLVNPGDLLREMVMKRDFRTPPIVAVFVLLGAFACGLVLCRGAVNFLFSMLSILLGASANTATAQGISYVTGKVKLPVGGAVALCQLVWMLLHTVVYMFFICRKCHVEFTWELALDFAAVVSMITIPCEILAMLLSLWTPAASLAILAVGAAVSHLQSCSMLSLITSLPEERLFRGKVGCVCIALLISIAATVLLSGGMLGTVWKRVVVLINSMLK